MALKYPTEKTRYHIINNILSIHFGFIPFGALGSCFQPNAVKFLCKAAGISFLGGIWVD